MAATEEGAMRAIAVLFAAALMAGCGERRDLVQNENIDGSAPAERSGAEANASGAQAPATGKTIPAALLGTYDSSIEACGRPSDMRLAVSATELRFHESIGTVRSVTSLGAGAVSVEADWQGEGERWRSVRELRLGDGGSTLTVSGDGTRTHRVRCPAEER